MNFDFNTDELALFEQIQTIAGRISEQGPEGLDSEGAETLIRKALKDFAETGYLAMGVQENDTIGASALMKAVEIIAAASPSLCLSVEMSRLVFGRMIAEFGGGPLADEILKPLLSGRIIGAVAMSESSMNVENDPFTTHGVHKGDTVEATGSKRFVVNGPWADWIAVAGSLKEGAALFIVHRDDPGLMIGDRIQTVGYEGAAVSEVTLNACRIPQYRVLGPFSRNEVPGQIRFWENQTLLGVSLGLMTAAFESAKAYAGSHVTGGKPIAAYQEVAFKLAEMLTLCHTARLFARRAAWTCAVDPKEGRVLTDCAKVFVTEAAEKVTGDALRILSGHGFMSGNSAEQAWRCSKYVQIAGVSTEIARVKIGDHVLGWDRAAID